MKFAIRLAVMALVLLVVALVSALTAMRLAIHVQEVEVPALVGMNPVDAERSIAGLGLQLKVEREYYSPQVPEGRIMSQLPLPGTRVRRGWQVRVSESMGPQRVAIPDVTGQSERAAELNIRRRGLEVASTAEIQIAGLPPDQVVAQIPPANASEVVDPKTDLLISAAADLPAFVMPSFVGQLLGNASRTLQDTGFKLGNVTMALGSPDSASSSTPASAPAASAVSPSAQPTPVSTIVAQTPPAGQKISAGATVNFVVR